MPAIWSSSERPITVRTVWVDGVRHAILTSDDPALVLSRTRRRPQTSSGEGKAYPLNYHCRGESFDESSAESLDSCFVKLHVVLDKRERDDEISSRIIRRKSAPPQCRRGKSSNSRNSLLELRLNGVLNFTGDYSGETTEDGQSNRSARRNNSARETLDPSRNDSLPRLDGITDRANEHCDNNCAEDSAAIADIEETTAPELHSNLLSERVLQWMDLSGRVIDYPSEEDKESRKKDKDRGGCSAKPKASYFRREYPAMSAKEPVTLKNYRMQTERKQQESDSRESRIARRRVSKDRESFDKIMMSNCKKGHLANCFIANDDTEEKRKSEDIRTDNSEQSNKNQWPSHGRPQLHIFMPDLNSSGEDVSSEESLIKD